MKRRLKIFALGTVLLLSLAACGGGCSANTNEEIITPTPTSTVAEVTEPEEVVKPEVVEPAKPENVEPEVVEKPEVIEPEETEKPEVVEPTEEVPAVEQKPDDSKPEPVQPDPAPEQTPVEPQPQPAEEVPVVTTPAPAPSTSFDSSINACMRNGAFDVDQYAYDSGCDLCYQSTTDFCIVYDLAWFVQAGSNPNYPGKGFIVIGRWNYDNPEFCNECTFSYTFDFGTGVTTAYGSTVPATALQYLPAVINAMKANPDPTVAPNVPGITFNPCSATNAFVRP